ncbi:MAG: hypothetical protein LHV68_05590 [Elusimicrobia bacterium]|nr:hypothetical protein [Candidatus Liberimonas magnetica]
MNFRIDKLRIDFKKSTEEIIFNRLNFFYGSMGAGKSTIARLIDYCLGGNLEETPALQSEFVSITLEAIVGDYIVSLTRDKNNNNIKVLWGQGLRKSNSLNIPARDKNGELIPDTGVEAISDFIFYLNGIQPPKVRKSKVREDSELIPLSLRDVFWYCYLDQDEIDSSFFNLELDADPFRRQKSKDVIRYLIGFHQDKVASLEMQVENLRQRKESILQGAEALYGALKKIGMNSERDIEAEEEEYKKELNEIATTKDSVRNIPDTKLRHSTEEYRENARVLNNQIVQSEEALSEINKMIENHEQLKNELIMLAIKADRVMAARVVLSAADFINCPRCASELPRREEGNCKVCGQKESDIAESDREDIKIQKADLKMRVNEIEEILEKHVEKRVMLEKEIADSRQKKEELDYRLSKALKHYDSIVMSNLISLEARSAKIEEYLRSLLKNKALIKQYEEMYENSGKIAEKEKTLRRELLEERKRAERDTSNLKNLEDLFLDCLIRAKLPGIKEEDMVTIPTNNLYPSVHSKGMENIAVTNFSNYGSGGKKTLFKACFALAIHRLSVKTGNIIPNLLIIDTPMKNISERENRVQFEGFYNLLYDLASSELQNTQFIIIDKEFFPPKQEFQDIFVRHMKPNEKHTKPGENRTPPLIPYYNGH